LERVRAGVRESRDRADALTGGDSGDGRHDAAGRLSLPAPPRLTRGAGVQCHRGERAAPPSVRGLERVSRRTRGVRHALLGAVAGRLTGRNDRAAGPSVVHRLPVPSRTEVAADAPAPAVRGLRRRRARSPETAPTRRSVARIPWPNGSRLTTARFSSRVRASSSPTT